MLALSYVTFFQTKYHCFHISSLKQEQQLSLYGSLIHMCIENILKA